jgi:hypothetical protein
VATPAADAATAAADAPQAAPSDETKAVAVDTTVATPVSATVGTDGKPVATKGKVKNVKKKKEKAPKLTPVNIVQGTLTVDGWTGKARMNYDIADLKYIYLWAPGVGTVVVSNVKFPLGKEEPNAFSGNTLKVDANGHTLELYSQKKLLKDKKPVSAWVYVDNAYQFASAFPAMGYGTTIAAPYAWPGAKVVQMAKTGAVLPPPLPKELVPAVAKPACVPAGSKAAGTPCPVTPAAPEVAPATATATTATSRTTQTN